ncbi:MAG: DUF4153 domain-containing protein, partial [Cyclobacteriaceae bacterium]|nr:DUF4153 domain-containing protein [Cyclobacteriaceae bacterium]
MKLLSLQYLVGKSKESFFRFPLTILSAFISVCLGIYLVEYGEEINDFLPYVNVLLTTALGIPLFFGVYIFIAKEKLHLKGKLLIQLGATFILLLIYFTLPDSYTTHNTSVPYIRYAIFNIIAHLLVSFVPYLRKRELNGFWNYNKVLFIRFLASVLYSGFLFVGLALALTAIEFLFDVNIHEELYFEMFIVIIGFFNTWFFVSGIPDELDELDSINEYPKGLKIFTQYILLPLLILYLVILYAYAGKILLNWDWPKGIVSYLISCVSVLGILTVLLLYPYGNLKENSWIKKFTDIYYYTLFPLIIILFIAIWLRIDDYGVTINRYVIVLLGVWLSIVSIYFSIRKTNIKFIPISLVVILLLMSFGPWSMFSVSERSQVNRLKKILEESSILTNGVINNEVIWETDSLPRFYSKNENTNESLLNDSIHNEVKSILDYLDDHHGFSSIRPWFKQNIDSFIEISLDSNGYSNEARIYMESCGLEYQYKYYSNNENDFHYSSIEEDLISVSNYDYYLEFDTYNYDGGSYDRDFIVDSLQYVLKYNVKENSELTIESNNDTLHFSLNPMIKDLLAEFGTESVPDIDK